MSLKQVESYSASAPPPVPLQTGVRRHYRRSIAVAAWLIVAAALAIVLWPLLVVYGRQLWGAEHYQFVPLLLAASGWIAWRRWQTLPVHRTLPASLAARLVVWGAALLATAGAVIATSPMLSFVAVLCMAIAGLYEWRGAAGLRHCLPAVAVLFLAVRPPFGWDQRLIMAMQQNATGWASGVLDLFGIRHLANGVVIRLPEGNFFVSEACSGVHSLFATLAFIAVFAAVTHRGWARVGLLMGAALFWVLVANVIRILAVVVLSTRLGLPVASGVGHEIIGIATFLIVVLMVLSFDRLMLYIVPLREALPSLVQADTGPEYNEVPPGHRLGRMAWAMTMALCFGGIAWGAQRLPDAGSVDAEVFAPSEGLVVVPEDVLPERWNGWQRTNFEFRENEHDLQGAFSRIWNFRKGRLQAAISIDGPFTTWHDTQYCYTGLGYDIRGRSDHFLDEQGPDAGGFTELLISGEHGQQGYVLFMAYTESGKALQPPATHRASVARLAGVLKDRMIGKAEGNPLHGRVFQVQLLAKGVFQFTDEEKEELRGMFHEMRGRVAEYVAASRAAGGPAETAVPEPK